MRTLCVGIAVSALLLMCTSVLAVPGVRDGLIPELPEPGASQNFVQLSGGGWWDGIYDYDAADTPWINVGGDPTVENIEVTCDIELYAYEWLSANKVYFHLKGDDYSPRSAVIAGLLKSNNGQYIGIGKPTPGQDLTHLKGTTDGWGRNVTQAPGYEPIPVTWELTEDGGTTWREADETDSWGANNTVYGMWWLIAQGRPCDHSFYFRITIKPKYHQPDGHYVMDPLLTVDPVL